MKAVAKIVPNSPAKRGPDVAMALIDLQRDGTLDHLYRFTNIPVNMDRSKQALAQNRASLASLPSTDDLIAFKQRVDAALARRSEEGTARHLALMMGAFPNARPHDPDSYVKLMLFDVMDLAFPDAVVALACQEIRRTARFLPAISEFVEVAQKQLHRWVSVARVVAVIERQRSNLQDIIALQERPQDAPQGTAGGTP